MFFKKAQKENQEESQWLSVSDLMAGLMMVFLFISVALMRQAFIDRDKIQEVAVAYSQNQVAIYQRLMDEFEQDLERWDADIDQDTLTFTFKSPEVLFATGSSSLTPRYAEILVDFFPRYMNVLRSFDESIDEVRIEGHTDSVWSTQSTEHEAYFRNMQLSQDRTRSVLEFVHEMSEPADRSWIKDKIAAVGFSSSRLKYIDDNPELGEDRNRSRRVTFRVITNADIQIKKILESSGL